jgi:hypothetical protein
MRARLWVAAAAAALTLRGEVPGSDDGQANPLRGLPSRPGPHIEKIENLGDNAWLELGVPAPDPKWGGARGRSWTSEMPLAPELRGAFLFGEGRHGYTKPDGRYMDDLWFYDINGHRWICCYPGADAKKLRLRGDRDGFETTRDGDVLPVAQQVHGYEMNTYDTEKKRLMSMPCPHSYWEGAMPQRREWLTPPPADASPWFYETTTGRWNRLRTGTRGPESGCGDTLIYIPGRDRAFFLHRSDDVWMFDTRAHRWERIEPAGPRPPFGIDATSCYDSTRHRICLGGGSYPVAPAGTNAFWLYDLKRHTWLDPEPKGSPCKGSTSYPTKNAVMVYDPVHDKVLLVFHSFHDDEPERLGVYVYDPKTNAWSEEAPGIPEALGRNRQAKNGFYDPSLNAVFIHSAGDSRDGGTIWVYRYRRVGRKRQ